MCVRVWCSSSLKHNICYASSAASLGIFISKLSPRGKKWAETVISALSPFSIPQKTFLKPQQKYEKENGCTSIMIREGSVGLKFAKTFYLHLAKEGLTLFLPLPPLSFHPSLTVLSRAFFCWQARGGKWKKGSGGERVGQSHCTDVAEREREKRT